MWSKILDMVAKKINKIQYLFIDKSSGVGNDQQTQKNKTDNGRNWEK